MSSNPVKQMKEVSKEIVEEILEMTRGTSVLSEEVAKCDSEKEANSTYFLALIVACLPFLNAKMTELGLLCLQASKSASDEDQRISNLMALMMVEKLDDLVLVHEVLSSIVSNLESLADNQDNFNLAGQTSLAKLEATLDIYRSVFEKELEED